jgi:hypothetical protein
MTSTNVVTTKVPADTRWTSSWRASSHRPPGRIRELTSDDHSVTEDAQRGHNPSAGARPRQSPLQPHSAGGWSYNGRHWTADTYQTLALPRARWMERESSQHFRAPQVFGPVDPRRDRPGFRRFRCWFRSARTDLSQDLAVELSVERGDRGGVGWVAASHRLVDTLDEPNRTG